MKISLDWLGEYVTWDDTPTDLAAKLTSAGLNVEGVERYGLEFPGVVVAKVVHREQHPNADRLSLCRVEDGTGEEVQVVCGAGNVREGITVLFARVGARLPGDFKIKKSKIRGVESRGMICSASELGLGEDSDGIIELETDLPVGTSADGVYGFTDTVLDIEVTPNRPDWLSHIGVAREVAAIYGTKVSMPQVWASSQRGESLGIKVRIDEYDDCPRYTAHGATEVKVGPSPDWMQNRLRAVGNRPINNIVDITNYVMLELGQPMHAFDRTKLTGESIIIDRAAHQMKVVTLDDQSRTVDAGTLLVSDENGPVALAGVMGLANSEVEESTTEILLESAFFAPLLVRQASRGMGLISDSSYRFERGADWEMVERAALRALYLFQELAGAHVISDSSDRFDPDRKSAEPVPLRLWQLNRVLGTKITTDEAAQMIQSLGLKVQPMGNPQASSPNAVNMMVKVPSFRRDIHLEVDLIEEIARRWGYDNLSGAGEYRVSGGGRRNGRQEAMARCRSWLSARGFHELVTSTFQLPGELDALQLADDDPRRVSLAVLDPRHGGETTLRTCLLPSLLDVARRNLNSGAEAPLLLYQINRGYRPGARDIPEPHHPDEHLLPQEPEFLQVAVVGESGKGPGAVPLDVLQIKGVLESLAAHLRVKMVLEPGEAEVWLQPGGQWRVLDGKGHMVGSAGRVRPEVLESFDLANPVAVAEIDLCALDLTPAEIRFEPFVRFPAVKRDLSLLVPDGVTYGEITAAVRKSAGPMLEQVELFDIYRGKGIPEGRGAYGIRLKFRSDKGNLKGKTVDGAISRMVGALAERLDIEHRTLD